MMQPYPPQYGPSMSPQYPGLPPGASVNAGNPALAYMQNNTAGPPMNEMSQFQQGMPQQNPYGAPQPAFVVPPQSPMYPQQPPMAQEYPQQQYAPQNMQMMQQPQMPYPQQQMPPQMQQAPMQQMMPYFGAEAQMPEGLESLLGSEAPPAGELGAPEAGADPFADMDLDELMKMLGAEAPPEDLGGSPEAGVGMPAPEALPTEMMAPPQPPMQEAYQPQPQPQPLPMQVAPMNLPPLGNAMSANAPVYSAPMMAPAAMPVPMPQPLPAPVAYPAAPPMMMPAPMMPAMQPAPNMAPPAFPAPPVPPMGMQQVQPAPFSMMA